MNASQLLKILHFVRQNELLKYWIKEWAKLNEAVLEKSSSMLRQVLYVCACFCWSNLQREQIAD